MTKINQMLVFDEILQSPNLREIIDELEAAWADEQKRRHEFWADIDENIKAEFIMAKSFIIRPFMEDIGWLRQIY